MIEPTYYLVLASFLPKLQHQQVNYVFIVMMTKWVIDRAPNAYDYAICCPYLLSQQSAWPPESNR